MQADDRDVGPGAREVDCFEPDLFGERGTEHAFGDDAELDEDLAEPFAARRLRAQRVAELLARKIAPLDEQTRRAVSSAPRPRAHPGRFRGRLVGTAPGSTPGAAGPAGSSGISFRLPQTASTGVTRAVAGGSLPVNDPTVSACARNETVTSPQPSPHGSTAEHEVDRARRRRPNRRSARSRTPRPSRRGRAGSSRRSTAPPACAPSVHTSRRSGRSARQAALERHPEREDAAVGRDQPVAPAVGARSPST